MASASCSSMPTLSVMVRRHTHMMDVLLKILHTYPHQHHLINQARHVVLGSASIIMLVLMDLLDMSHHLKLLSLYVVHHLITYDIQCVTLSHLNKDIIKGAPDSGIIIPPIGLVSGGCTYKSVRSTVCSVCVEVLGAPCFISS